MRQGNTDVRLSVTFESGELQGLGIPNPDNAEDSQLYGEFSDSFREFMRTYKNEDIGLNEACEQKELDTFRLILSEFIEYVNADNNISRSDGEEVSTVNFVNQ